MNPLVIAIALPMLAAGQLLLGRSVFGGKVAACIGAVAMSGSFLALCVAHGASAGDGWYASVDKPWIDALGVHFHLGLDGISWPLAMMTAFLAVLGCVSLFKDDTEPSLVALVLVISGASIGVFASLDLLLFFLFFELALIPMWFVIAWWGDPHDQEGRRYAATRFLLFTVLGSAFMLVGFVIVAVHAHTLQITAIADSGINAQTTIPLAAVAVIAIGFAVKTPLVPLHTWLPDAHSKAPTVGSVLLAGVFLKLGTYGLIRICVDMLPESTARIAPYLAVAGVIGIIYSSLACLAQDDLKRMIAFSSVGHMGFVVLGLSTMSEVGVAAAVFGSVAHGLITGLLFFNAGWLKERYGTASLKAMGRGLYARAPWLGAVFTFAAVASLGLPGLGGFWGEMLSLRAAYDVGPVLDKSLAWILLGVAATGIILTTAFFARAIRLLNQGEPTPQPADRDLTVNERMIGAALAASIIVLGVAPGLLMGPIEVAVKSVLGAS
ncbi:MAG: NADH-quinone oxidoreductase subunit M [Aeromicrobium sp.]